MALAHFQETIGRVLSDGDVFIGSGASVEVRDETNGALAAIFTDRDGTTAKSNPFNADSQGFADFYASTGRYRVKVSIDGDIVLDLRDFDVIGDLDTFPVTTSTGTDQPLSEALDDRVNKSGGDVTDTIVTSSSGTGQNLPEALDDRISKDDLSASILSSSKDFKLSTQMTRRIDVGEFVGHKAFSVSLQTSDGTLFVFYRRADVHGVDESGTMYMIKSTDNGYSWTTPAIIHSDPDRDIRNYGGCVTDSDTILVWTEAVRTVGTEGQEFDTAVLRSTDGGDTFSYSVESSSDTNRLVPHGRSVVIGTKIIQSLQRTPSEAFVTAESNDDGQTWSFVVQITTFPSDTSFTEPYLAYLGSDRIAGFARNNFADNTEMLYFRSSDGGANWSSVTKISRVTMGRNPPVAWFNSSNNLVTVLWPSRGSTRMSDGGTGEFWPWYYTYIDADVLWDDVLTGDNFRFPVALPINGPAFVDGNTGAEQGYGHVLDTPNGKMLTYHMGNAESPASSDLFMSNLSMMIEGII